MQLSYTFWYINVIQNTPKIEKEIETSIFNFPIQRSIGESKIKVSIEENSNPIVRFTLEKWYTVVKLLKLEMDLLLLKWILYDNTFIPGKLDSSLNGWH